MLDPAELAKAIRKRPGMYVGDTEDGRGLHQLVYGMIDDALGDHPGCCSRIDVHLHADGSVTIEDDGEDHPVRLHELATFIGESRGDRCGPRCTPWTGYMGGMFVDGGAIVANALSERLDLEIRGGGKVFAGEYAKGVPVSELSEIGVSELRGTRITVRPDPEVFTNIVALSFEPIADRLRDIAYVRGGLQTRLRDERTGQEAVFVFRDGVASCVRDQNAQEAALSELIAFSGVHDGVDVDVAMQWIDRPSQWLTCFANTKRNRRGGTHASGFWRALAATAVRYGAPLRQHIRDGLTAAISIRCTDPQYSNLDRDELCNPEVEAAVAAVVAEELGSHFERHPELVEQLAARLLN